MKDKMMRSKRQQSFATSPSRVLIVDDHELMRNGLRLLIDSEPDFEICGEAVDETSARRMIRESKPDVAVVDLTLHGGSGLDLIKWITQHHPETKTIVSTMHNEQIYGTSHPACRCPRLRQQARSGANDPGCHPPRAGRQTVLQRRTDRAYDESRLGPARRSAVAIANR